MGCCNSVDVNTDETMIQKYITEDCNFRRSNGSSIDLSKQLKMERIEIICMGCFLYNNKELIENKQIEILFRDRTIANTKYRPDLMFRQNGKVYHVEINENSHSGYDKTKEQERHDTIKSFCLATFGTYKLIRFNPHVFGKLENEHDKMVIANQFSNLLSSIQGLLSFEVDEN